MGRSFLRGAGRPDDALGREVLELVELKGDETIVDAGCGTGRVTELLFERLPDGVVLAVDVSEQMVEAAAERFAGDGRVRVERQDLLELDAGEMADVIFSTATFHWILRPRSSLSSTGRKPQAGRTTRRPVWWYGQRRPGTGDRARDHARGALPGSI